MPEKVRQWMRRHTCETWQCNWPMRAAFVLHNKDDAREVLGLVMDLLMAVWECAAASRPRVNSFHFGRSGPFA